MWSQGTLPELHDQRYRHFTKEEEAMNAEELNARWTHFQGDLKQPWKSQRDVLPGIPIFVESADGNVERI
jgi:hypothetical protein